MAGMLSGLPSPVVWIRQNHDPNPPYSSQNPLTGMCFCEPVSYAAGALLTVGGVFAGWKALSINKRYFPVSQMPTLAGLQQFTEAHVWMGMNNSDPSMVWWAAMGFIFFSWLIWPVWVPFSI